MNPDFFEHLKKFKTNPYLFVGSGLSRRYLGLPTWENLLMSFFKGSEISGEFEYFQSLSDSNLPRLATILAKEFHEVWWKSNKFKLSRDISKTIAKTKKEIPLKLSCQILSTIHKLK